MGILYTKQRYINFKRQIILKVRQVDFFEHNKFHATMKEYTRLSIQPGFAPIRTRNDRRYSPLASGTPSHQCTVSVMETLEAAGRMFASRQLSI